jgi:hypothetical protein
VFTAATGAVGVVTGAAFGTSVVVEFISISGGSVAFWARVNSRQTRMKRNKVLLNFMVLQLILELLRQYTFSLHPTQFASAKVLLERMKWSVGRATVISGISATINVL